MTPFRGRKVKLIRSQVEQVGRDPGPINESATSFQHDFGRRISLVSGEDREPQFLFQRISVAIQRFNAVLLHDGLLSSDHPD